MWLFTNFGFFSIVQKPGKSDLSVRARVAADLDALRTRYLPELGPTLGKAGSDYPWRASVSHGALGAAMGRIVADLEYPNFKDEVAIRQGKARVQRYHKVWNALLDLPEEPKVAKPAAGSVPWPDAIPAGLKVAYGGVLIDRDGQVLLREPRNHHDNYVWTFAKGRPDPGEAPEATALREVLEETGVQARILAPIPGDFLGGTTINRYFLMVPEGPVQALPPDTPETSATRWVLPAEAKALIAQTKNAKGRERDLAVLKAGLGAWKHHRP